jgi:serine/threonine protein kinase
LADDADRQAHARVGSVLDDKWTLERLLGIGGMAAVYGARHRNGARAAVKVLHAEFSSHKDVRERFLREGYAANRVEHAGAVKVLDDDVVATGPAAGTAYIVMELLEGESLQERLERGPPIGELEFLAIARSVLEVLEAAHSRGVVHRDLKPENLFLVRGEADAKVGTRVKVLDFGLARLLQGQAITSYGLALGTPSFMSPEQAAGRIDEIDGRTDLFALAATGFRLCTGRRIHEALNPVDLVLKMANLAAPRVRAVRPGVSEPCARIIDRALEFRREDRYATATAMLEDVKRAVAELEVSGPTQLAIPGETPEPLAGLSGRRDARSGEDATIELSDGDLLRQSAGPVPEESVRVPRRRSIVPWLALVALGAAGAKLWLDHSDRSGNASSAPTAESGLPTAGAAPSALAPVVVHERDASSGTPSAPPSASLSKPTAAPAPATSAPHTAPGRLGPGNVHKLPRKHHPSKPRTTQ